MEEVRGLLSSEDNDFTWSSWDDRNAGLAELDEILFALRGGFEVPVHTLRVLFAPTGPIQEVSLSSGWGDAFIALADRFDEAMVEKPENGEHAQDLELDSFCGCLENPIGRGIHVKELGMDSRFAEISVFQCRDCGRHWLRYFYEVEAFTRSGRWYLGCVTPEQFAGLTVENAKGVMEALDWYLYGGSYYNGLMGKTSGEIQLIS